MEAQYKTANGRLTIKLDSQDAKGLFRQIAATQAIFEAESKCGCCNSANIAYNVRVHDDNEYYELVCNDCTAQFSFGQTKKGGNLFAKRRDKDNNTLPNRGWRVWKRDNASYDSAPPVNDQDIPF